MLEGFEHAWLRVGYQVVFEEHKIQVDAQSIARIHKVTAQPQYSPSRYAVDRNGQQSFERIVLSRARSAACGGRRPLTKQSFRNTDGHCDRRLSLIEKIKQIIG
jgi:hypothetical protein